MEVWRAILARVGAESRVLRSVLEHAVLQDISAVRVRVALPPASFHGRIATDRENLDMLRRAVHAHFGASVPVEVTLAKTDEGGAVMSSSEVRAAEESRVRAERVREAEALPAVRAAMSVFDGAVKAVRTELDLPAGQGEARAARPGVKE
jgi:hypothetical protein